MPARNEMIDFSPLQRRVREEIEGTGSVNEQKGGKTRDMPKPGQGGAQSMLKYYAKLIH